MHGLWNIFAGVWDMKIGYVLCGIIWSLACGFAVGNYACSLVHRLPRGKLILDKTPYCGNCGTLLKTIDLFPVFSAMLLRHRCRYCKQPFPVSHTWTEILVGLLFVFAFFQHAYGQEFLMIAFIGVFLITLAAIEVNDRLIMSKIVLCLIIFGMVYRSMLDGTIFNFFQGGLTAGLIAALFWRKEIQKVGHVYMAPPQVQMFVAGGVCVGYEQLPLFALLFAAFTLLFFLFAKLRRKKLALSIPFGLAVMIPVMYPSLSLLTLLTRLGM